MRQMYVIYWSASGNTEAMAGAIAEGGREAGAAVRLCTVSDITPDEALDCDLLALGCPAMGAEQLEESEFEPMWQTVKGNLIGKRIGLFGSYGWGDGEWMRVWHADAESEGIGLCTECVLGHEAPDEETLEKCRALGQAVAA